MADTKKGGSSKVYLVEGRPGEWRLKGAGDTRATLRDPRQSVLIRKADRMLGEKNAVVIVTDKRGNLVEKRIYGQVNKSALTQVKIKKTAASKASKVLRNESVQDVMPPPKRPTRS